MTIKIIFFLWVALVPADGYKASELVYQRARCDKAGGVFSFWRATPRTYTFRFGGVQRADLYSGYDIVCYRLEGGK